MHPATVHHEEFPGNAGDRQGMVPSPCVPGGTDAGRDEQQREKDRNSAEAMSDDSTSKFVLRYLLFHSGLHGLRQYCSPRLLILSVANERLAMMFALSLSYRQHGECAHRRGRGRMVGKPGRYPIFGIMHYERAPVVRHEAMGVETDGGFAAVPSGFSALFTSPRYGVSSSR